MTSRSSYALSGGNPPSVRDWRVAAIATGMRHDSSDGTCGERATPSPGMPWFLVPGPGPAVTVVPSVRVP